MFEAFRDTGRKMTGKAGRLLTLFALAAQGCSSTPPVCSGPYYHPGETGCVQAAQQPYGGSGGYGGYQGRGGFSSPLRDPVYPAPPQGCVVGVPGIGFCVLSVEYDMQPRNLLQDVQIRGDYNGYSSKGFGAYGRVNWGPR